MALRKIGAVTDLKITGDNPRPIDKRQGLARAVAILGTRYFRASIAGTS